MANQTINQCDVDWFALVKEVTKIKYGDQLAEDNRDKAKQYAFSNTEALPTIRLAMHWKKVILITS